MTGKENKILPISKLLGIVVETKIRFLRWKTWEDLGIFLFLIESLYQFIKSSTKLIIDAEEDIRTKSH